MNKDKIYNFYNNLSIEERKELLGACLDDLGVIDTPSATKLLKVSRSRVYQIMNDFNTLEIGKHKFLMLNVYLNHR